MKSSNAPQPELSIVVPAFNEAARINRTLSEIVLFMQDSLPEVTYEVVLSVQGNDSTAELARQAHQDMENLIIIDSRNTVGKGQNVHAGLQAAHGTYAMFMDADLATPLHHLPALLSKLRDGTDVVMAQRNLVEIHKWLRTIVSVGGNLAIRLLVMKGVHDTQCGFKGFSRRAIEIITERQTIFGWGFDIEYLVIAIRHKLTIDSFEITDWYDPKEFGAMADENPIKAGLSVFIELIKIKLNDIAGRYS